MRVILKKRKKNRAGFSLAETLIVILILLMVSAVVAGAIPTASNVYAKTVDAANAQVLLSTVVTVLRDELSTAVDVKTEGSTVLLYKNGNDGYRKIEIKSDPKEIRLYIGKLNPSTGEIEYGDSRLLVSDKAATKNLVAYCDTVSFEGGLVKFGNLKVERNGVALASRSSLSIRTVK